MNTKDQSEKEKKANLTPIEGNNNLAVIGFIFSFLGPAAIIGLIISIASLIKSKKFNGENKTFALAGIIISTAMFIFSALVIIWMILVITKLNEILSILK